jgi:Family of unknown function (DUF6194)
VTEEDLIRFATSLEGVAVVTAGPDNGAPEVAWGDSFIFYDPPTADPSAEPDRRFPFATIVTKDYPGFDESSHLDRPGVYRLNISVGKRAFQDLFGYPPADHHRHADAHDYAALDTVLPNPVYARNAWISILNPATHTTTRARSLLTAAHALLAGRHK